jgi:hypothetical protein
MATGEVIATGKQQLPQVEKKAPVQIVEKKEVEKKEEKKRRMGAF